MKALVQRLVRGASARARVRRAELFRRSFVVDSNTRILDLGSEDGSAIASVLAGTTVEPRNVHIADIGEAALIRGQARFGFTPVMLDESGRLPFPDKFFDIVYCSSVIEHVTVPKSQVWTMRSGKEFRRQSAVSQAAFAQEIQRVGRTYFVQTPNRWFPIESHSWLPLIGYLPRRLLVPCLRITNRVWIKVTAPDWRLLSTAEMRALFPEAALIQERMLGLPKSIIALKK